MESTGWERTVELWEPVLGTEATAGLVESWRSGLAPYVRVHGVDVVRVSDVISGAVLDLLTTWRIPCGPVLINVPGAAVEVLVPSGTATRWRPVSKTACVAGALLRCPAPDVTRASGRWVEGRTWARPPGTGPVTTNPEALTDALHTVLAAAVRRRIEAAGAARLRPGRPGRGRP